jgi:hypothetical protein
VRGHTFCQYHLAASTNSPLCVAYVCKMLE